MRISFEQEFRRYIYRFRRYKARRRFLHATKFSLLKKAFFRSRARSISRSRLMERFYDRMKLVSVLVYVFDESEGLPEDEDCRIESFDLTAAQHGSGFLISPNGHIITASHVINAADDSDKDTASDDSDDEIILRRYIVLADRPDTVEECRLVYDDPLSDVAVMQIMKFAQDYNFCKIFGGGEDITMGMQVMSIAQAGSLPFSFAMGRVSFPSLVHGSLLPKFGFELADDIPLIRLHIHVWAGASGGPVFDSQGRVIGMLSFDYDISSISGSEDEAEKGSFPSNYVHSGLSRSVKVNLFVCLHRGERVSLWKCLLMDEAENILFENDKIVDADDDMGLLKDTNDFFLWLFVDGERRLWECKWFLWVIRMNYFDDLFYNVQIFFYFEHVALLFTLVFLMLVHVLEIVVGPYLSVNGLMISFI
ncbi:hypothetical protein RHMOL_Rhmol07G0030200 [Rhododendron molle]|uniref:Uncharacterized protein n=1 Tax=Rhododendron molle TaxID=49168 RepID=A0ACC0MWJ3_RHOML|nr:hypothetical protein RHMOL_Rhmol07G0030200 [Rhododendron molle]